MCSERILYILLYLFRIKHEDRHFVMLSGSETSVLQKYIFFTSFRMTVENDFLDIFFRVKVKKFVN
jgi:hypothetical protein